MKRAVALVVLCAATPAWADDGSLYERLWPRMPLDPLQRDFGTQLEDGLTELGYQLNQHMGALSKDMFAMRVDGRRRRAFVRLGTTDDNNGKHLTFRIANDIDFNDGTARISTTIDVGIAERVLHLQLPDWEMAPTTYRGDYGVELRLPLFRRTF